MMYDPQPLITNARTASGHCADCPAACDGRSQNVHPGYFNTEDADIMFVGIEADHTTNPEWYESIHRYNEASGSAFLRPDKGGHDLARALQLVSGVEITDTWVTDTLKCPPADGDDSGDRETAWRQCQHYLTTELDAIDPEVVVALGDLPRKRLLAAVLGRDDLIATLNTAVTKDVGRILPTSPPLISATHWSYGHLTDSPHSDWGEGWVDGVDYFSRAPRQYGSNLQILQEALASAYPSTT